MLVEAEITDEDGVTKRLTDAEIISFAFLLLAAGSGTTWKQMGITMVALLGQPEWLAAVRDDPEMLRSVVEESLRWTPTDPMFSRFVARDTEVGGIDMPRGSVVHVCLAAANRDPARWDDPDRFDPGRPIQSHLGFGSGVHICLGMHVARAEVLAAVGAWSSDCRICGWIRRPRPRGSSGCTSGGRIRCRSASTDISPSLASAHSVPPARRAEPALA